MNLIESVLLENVDNPCSLFVFPTDVAASRWADHLLRLRQRLCRGPHGGGTIAMEKFIAWDTFKQNSIRSKVQNRQSISSALRKMFVSALIRENAELCARGEPPVFLSLIRTEWAQEADSFTGWLTEILPQLGTWFRKTTGLPITALQPEAVHGATAALTGDDSDLFSLAVRYAKFLDEHGLFEPAWETPPFENAGKECFIFFPESLFDFSEYRDLLAASGHVKTIYAGDTGAEHRDVFFYTNSRSEITEAALYIIALHENQNIPWDSISVSIPDAEKYEPYLLREFSNRNIPWIKQSGKPLASYPAGQFFAAVSGCISAGFSFASLTSLLLNRHLPWKNPDDIQNLIEFGIANNCISSWIEDTQSQRGETLINVWEDAFAQPFGRLDPQARRFFTDLKHHIMVMRNADSFSGIRKHYFAFRERFFDMENCLSETGLILSRCISELMYLIELEKSFPGVRVPDPYGFFTGYLAEVNYLAQQSASGVAILPYRTAAPAPFDCHIVLGAGQDNLSAVFSPLAFLPGGKREKLGITDNDASSAFIKLHQYNSRLPAAFFCAEQTFSGYAIPHSALNAALKPQQRFGDDPVSGVKFAADLYRMENKMYAAGNFSAQAAMPSAIHKNQKQGFEEWHLRRKQSVNGDEALIANKPLLELIRKRFCNKGDLKDKFSVSSTSLESYFQCSLKWIFERVLELENIEIETGLMADNIAGQVYHAVLNLLLDELRETGEPIAGPLFSGSDQKPLPVLPDSWRSRLAEKTEMVFASFPRLPRSEKPVMSALTARLLRAEKQMFVSSLERFLAAFISFFAGFRVLASEKFHSLQRDFYCLNGIIDCVLEDARDDSPEKGSAVIVDFKTKKMPNPADCTGEDGLANFQLPMYLRLAESALKKEVHTALFFSIIDAAPQVLFGVIENVLSGGNIPKKEEDRITRGSGAFIRIMDDLDKKAEQFAKEISTGAFSVFSSGVEQCLQCSYNRVCRTVYKIDQGKNNGA